MYLICQTDEFYWITPRSNKDQNCNPSEFNLTDNITILVQPSLTILWWNYDMTWLYWCHDMTIIMMKPKKWLRLWWISALNHSKSLVSLVKRSWLSSKCISKTDKATWNTVSQFLWQTPRQDESVAAQFYRARLLPVYSPLPSGWPRSFNVSWLRWRARNLGGTPLLPHWKQQASDSPFRSIYW